MTGEQRWDVFVSYARADEAWVRGELYPALLSRLVDGRAPRVFVDVEPDGIPPGSGWLETLAHAVQHSRFFVAVYSQRYFASRMCCLELNWSMGVHSGAGRLIPVLIDTEVQVPFTYSQINWLSVRRADWVDRLCGRLGLTGERHRPRLAFAGAIADVQVNHTLPEQRVELTDPGTGAPAVGAEEVTVSAGAADGSLRGTLTVTSRDGVATFRDLSFAAPADAVRLFARCAGGEAVPGPPFAVRQPTPAPPAAGSGTPPELMFHLDGPGWLAVVQDRTLRLTSVAGEVVAQAALDDVPRLRARWRDRAAVAGWSGRVAVADAAGRARSYRLGSGIAVPGVLCPVDDRLHVGMWDGSVWALDLDSPEPERVLHHDAGVQALTYADGRLLVAGLDGVAAWYALDGTRLDLPSLAFEPVLWGLTARAGCVVAVGADAVHRLDLASGEVISLRLMSAEAVGAIVETDQAVVYDRHGHGLRFDVELEVRAGFRPPDGARPVDHDASGVVLVTAHPDGSHALLVAERVVHVNRSGPMAVSADGNQVTLADGRGLRTVAVADLLGTGAR